MKKIKLDSFDDIEVSVSVGNPADLINKLIDKLTHKQRSVFFDELVESFHEDFAKRVLATPDFFFGDTFDEATRKEGLLNIFVPNKGSIKTRKLIHDIIDLVDQDNYFETDAPKANEDKLLAFIKTLE